jgi:hypothetical protein
MEVSYINTRSDESVGRQDPANAAEMQLIQNLEVPRSPITPNDRSLPSLDGVNLPMAGLDKIADFSLDDIKIEIEDMDTEQSYMGMMHEPSIMENTRSEPSVRGHRQSEASLSFGTPKQHTAKFKFMKTISNQFHVLSKRATIKKREEPNPVPIKPSPSIESYTDVKAEKGYSERISIISRVLNSRSSRTERVVDSQNLHTRSRASTTSKLFLMKGSVSHLKGTEETKTLADIFAASEIQVNVKWGSKSTNLKISPTTEVSTVLKSVLKAYELLNAEEDVTDKYLIGKQDRQNPGMRLWFNPKLSISAYELLQGDELLLKHTANVEQLRLIVPPSIEDVFFEYEYNVLVSDAIKQLKEKCLVGEQACGLYNPRLGMWLDSSKALFTYELEENRMELRALVNEMLVRVHLADFDQRIAIKVLPTFNVADVISMIKYQMFNRKLVSLKAGHYGLFVNSSSQWMKASAKIEDYPIAKTVLNFLL